MIETIIKKTDHFVKEAFQKNPHYSFNDWTVMYEHSKRVKDIAFQIASEQVCDNIVVMVSAFLHDIGKIYKADQATLHHDHEKLNSIVAKDFLDSLEITTEQRKKIDAIITGDDSLIESKIVADADKLAFYLDHRLYMLWIEWAEKSGVASIEDRIRKLEQYKKLNFSISVKIGAGSWDKMRRDWEEYLKK